MRSTQVKFLYYSTEKIAFYREKLKITLVFSNKSTMCGGNISSFFNTKFEDRIYSPFGLKI